MYLLWMICIIYWCKNVLTESPPFYLIENANSYFEDFMVKFNKKYANENEKEAHSVIFKNNLDIINRMNQESDDAIYGINKFMDLTIEEFNNKVKCLEEDVPNDNAQCEILYDTDITDAGAPESFDWRARNAVTAVKDQGECRSCYAFSTCGQLEGRNAIKHRQLVDLSPQQIVDCDTRSQRCRGGYMSAALRALLELGGPMKEVDYPYVEQTQKCRSNRNKTVVKLTNCFTYNLKSQEKLKQLLYKSGPIAVGLIGADGMAFYEKGIITDARCSKGHINHAVLLVGYGRENGIPYWTCKNSLGSNWGESGYFRMQRGENAHSCGMMNQYMATADIE